MPKKSTRIPYYLGYIIGFLIGWKYQELSYLIGSLLFLMLFDMLLYFGGWVLRGYKIDLKGKK